MRIREGVSITLRDLIAETTPRGVVFRLRNRLGLSEWDETKRVVGSLGGDWDSRSKHFTIPGGRERLDWVVRNQEIETLDTIPTPATLAADLVALAVRPGDAVLEPSAGEGSLARAAARAAGPSGRVSGIEINAQYLAHAVMEHMALDKATCAPMSAMVADFLHETPEPLFDAVVMSVPFERQRDIDHFLHAYEFLKPGGRIAAIMNTAVRSATNAKGDNFRVWVRSLGGSMSIGLGESRKEHQCCGAQSFVYCVVSFTKPPCVGITVDSCGRDEDGLTEDEENDAKWQKTYYGP